MTMNLRWKLCALSAVLLTSASPAAALQTFFGQDLAVTGPAATARSVAARDRFIAALATHATEDFEAFGAGVVDPTLDFGEFGIATASDGFIASADRFGAHAFSGQKYLASDGTITITFTRSISAFGFFGSDLNEVNRVALRLTDTLGNITDLAIPGRFPATSGSNMFFGFADRQVRYTAISLQNAPSGQDGFGFDDLIVGNSMVPEPADWIMLIAGFGVTGAALRFRRRVTNIYPKSRRRVPV